MWTDALALFSATQWLMASADPARYPAAGYRVKPFSVNLSEDVPRMLDLVRDTRLPSGPEYAGLGDAAGIDWAVLKDLQEEWSTSFDWKKEQSYLESFDHYIVAIEGLDIHFVYKRSAEPDAIPLLLLHGWPGSFLEFLPIVRALAEAATTSTGKPVSFDVIVPSLPGFAFSEAPPANWTINDTARIFNKLMTEALRYDKFAVFGTDWGCGPAYVLYDEYSTTTRAAHFDFLPFIPLGSQQLAASNITLNSSLEIFELAGLDAWLATGFAYFQELSTKPNAVGLALYDNPVGQLAWMGEKFISWSDPRAGTGPSVVTHTEILRHVSLYYLTKSFVSSVFIYYQNALAGTGFRTEYTKAATDAPMLFSAFKYNNGFWPPQLVAKVGNLVSYRNHDFGGHFPGLDNPPALLEDLREIGSFWEG